MVRFATFALLSFAACGQAPAAEAGSASGYFRMGENRQEYRHAVALSRDTTGQAGERKVLIFLTTHPVDAARAAASFDLDTGVTDQLREVDGGMTRITVDGSGAEAGVWWWVSEPMDTFNTSGFGTLSFELRTDAAIKGSFRVDAPREFFDKTYQFDLTFDAPVTRADFAGAVLPAGGGEPGKAWLAYVEAVRTGDVDFLRTHLGTMAEWMLPKDDAAASASYVESLRYGVPATATVRGGWQISPDRAVLRIEGKDGDGNLQRGLVQVTRDADSGRWQQDGQDLVTTWQ